MTTQPTAPQDNPEQVGFDHWVENNHAPYATCFRDVWSDCWKVAFPAGVNFRGVEGYHVLRMERDAARKEVGELIEQLDVVTGIMEDQAKQGRLARAALLAVQGKGATP